MEVDRILITGGAGFIGSNTADYFASKGHMVYVIDNLTRKGTEKNLHWIQERHPNLRWFHNSITDSIVPQIIERNKPDVIFHLAGQVAVTSSVEDPIKDKEINLDGTLNILEGVRKFSPETQVVFSSTNKVYGDINQELTEKDTRYKFKDKELDDYGISEEQNLDFHSPYGCSKGAADQYVRDYARIYGLNTVVFRQSCIYGPRQFGNEDQGWVMHFVMKALKDEVITIYGDGKQVRDLLHINDLLKLYAQVVRNRYESSGSIYNIGGGPENTISLIELVGILESKLSRKIKLKSLDWRPGDQKVYVSDISKIKEVSLWEPEIGVEDGIDDLINWGKSLLTK